MILGGISAFAIVALVSFLVAINRKRCCADRHKRGYDEGLSKNSARKLKKRKIGYDIPIRSKPMVSSVVWQQEENDIADEVKKIYGNISNCSEPVVFEMSNGIWQQNEFDAMQTKHVNVGKKEIARGDKKTRGDNKLGQPTLKMNLGLDLKKPRQGDQGRSSYQRQVVTFLSKGQEEKKPAINIEDVYMEKAKRSHVQEWVENSVKTINDKTEVTKGENSKNVLLQEVDGVGAEFGNKGENFQWQENGNLQCKDENVNQNCLNHEVDFDLVARNDDDIGLEGCDVNGKDAKALKSCLKKSKKEGMSDGLKENIFEKSFEEIKQNIGMKNREAEEGTFDQRKLKLTDKEDFKTVRDVKKLIVTRWIDHSAAHNKSCVVEEESDATLAEKSANELEYEDIDSILTSVSRMDEGRISKLKATDFYKQLLKKKITGYKAAGEKIDEVSLVSNEEKRLNKEEIKTQNMERIGEEKMALIRESKLSFSGQEKKAIVQKNERESLPESSDLNQDKIDKIDKSLEKTERRNSKEDSFVSEFSIDENDITLKYSIVRNFSDRLKPMIFVSLQHIRGLGRVFGYDNTARARLYFANDGEEYEESEPMKCEDDIYQEEMFSVIGTSTKAIVKDLLVIEMILEDNDEPELYVTVPLDGLRHKATLIDSVTFLPGRFEE